MAFELCDGNIGCYTFMVDAYDIDARGARTAFCNALAYGIRGSRLYQLWNDCCGRDTRFTLEVLQYYDEETINRHIEGDGCHGTPIKRKEWTK